MKFAAFLLLLLSPGFDSQPSPPFSPPHPKEPPFFPLPLESNYATGGSMNEMINKLSASAPEQNVDPEYSLVLPITKKPFESLQQKPQGPKYDETKSEIIAKNVLKLSTKLVENILTKKSNKYEIVSPISISSALQLAMLGAHNETYDELSRLLGFDVETFANNKHSIHDEFGAILEDLTTNIQNPSRCRTVVPWRYDASEHYLKKFMKYQSNFPNSAEHEISVANGIFVQNGFSIGNEYEKVVKNVYKSEVRQLDFRNHPQESAKFVNDWVNEKTHGKIKEILPSGVNPETRVILTNALYFKAEWQMSFIEGGTMSKKFYPHGRQDTENFLMVDMMAHGGSFPHFFDPECDCEILGLPYKQNATTMYVIMPRNSNPTTLLQLQKTMTAEKFESMVKQMRIKTAVILFPKMHLTSSIHLKSDLKDLGVNSLFEESRSDLSVLSGIGDSLIFSRNRRDVKYKVESEHNRDQSSLTMKDLVLRKRIIKKSALGKKKLKRNRREYESDTQKLEKIRNMRVLRNPHLFAEDVIHKVELTVNEKGTEGGAATAISLNRSGTNVVFRVDVPFMFIIRHDPTHIPLFYGVVFEPQNN